MYRLFYIVLLSFSFLSPGNALARKHNIVSGNYIVNGVCTQCKSRIENAAYLKGVKYASWNVDTHNLTLKYNASKTSFELILKSIAKAGHDSEYFKATDEDYNKLPDCCRYRSDVKKH